MQSDTLSQMVRISGKEAEDVLRSKAASSQLRHALFPQETVRETKSH